MRKFGLLYLLFCVVALVSAQAQEWTYSYPASERDSFQSAQFLLVLNPKITQPQSVIVFVSGEDVDARWQIKNRAMMDLALKTRSILLGCKFSNRPSQDFSVADQGGRLALDTALIELSKKSEQLKDINQVSLFMVGKGQGAQFVYEYAMSGRDRVAGLVVEDPFYLTKSPARALQNIPILFLSSKFSPDPTSLNTKAFFKEQRKYGALWCRLSQEGNPIKFSVQGLISLFIEETLVARIDERSFIRAPKILPIMKGWTHERVKGSPAKVIPYNLTRRGQEADLNWYATQNLAEKMMPLAIGQP